MSKPLLILAFSALAVESQFVDWSCISRRALSLRLDSIDHWSYDVVDCPTWCANWNKNVSVAFHSGDWCLCYAGAAANLRLAPSDLDGRCDNDDVFVSCREDACCDLRDGMRDRAWFGDDLQQFQDWMNFFPKCLHENHLGSSVRPGSDVYFLEDVVKICKNNSKVGDGYSVITRHASKPDHYSCGYLTNADDFYSYDGTLTMDDSCNLCHIRPNENLYQHCGGKDVSSVYCLADECKRYKNGQNIAHYFGCFFDKFWIKDEANATTVDYLDDCFQYCLNNGKDVTVTAKNATNIDCLCYDSHTIGTLDLKMEELGQGCERQWSPDVGGPVGETGESPTLLYSLHCFDSACDRVLNTMVKNVYPVQCDVTTPSMTSSVSISTSPRTTLNPPCDEFCESRVDDRGFEWPQICVGHPFSSPAMCPVGTTGTASWTCESANSWKPRQPDRTNCVAEWVNSVEAEANRVGGDAKNITLAILKHVQDYSNRSTQLTSGTLKRLVSVGFLLPTRMADNASIVEYSKSVELTTDVTNDYIEITADLFHHELSWTEDEYAEMIVYATDLQESAERLAFYLLGVAEVLKCDHSDQLRDSREEVLVYVDVLCGALQSHLGELPTPPYIDLVSESGIVDGSWKSVGVSYAIDYVAQGIFVAESNTLPHQSGSVFVFNNYEDIKSFSPVINEDAFLPEDTTTQIQFFHVNKSSIFARAPRYCVYWDTSALLWSSEGCDVDSEFTDEATTVCSCDHTTSFAVIFDVNGSLDNLSDSALKALDIISIVFCSISITCCLLTVIVLAVSKLPSSPRTVIQINRAATLFFLYFFLLFGLDPDVLNVSSDSVWCRFSAVAIQYFGLAAFTWTAIEGYQLYQALVRKQMTDVNGKYSNLVRYVVGYGAPLVIVSITMIVAYTAFEGEAYARPDPGSPEDVAVCWLSESTFIWAFVGPAAVVIAFNFFVMIRAMIVVAKAQKRSNRTEGDKIKANLKSFIILTFLLGITWSFGLLINGSLAGVFAFVFVVLNGSIGVFIFVHSVLLNESIMAELKVRLRLKQRGTFAFNFGGLFSTAVKPNEERTAHDKSSSAEFTSDVVQTKSERRENQVTRVRTTATFVAAEDEESPSNSQHTEITTLSESLESMARRFSGNGFASGGLNPIAEEELRRSSRGESVYGETEVVRRNSVIVPQPQQPQRGRTRSISLVHDNQWKPF